MKWVAVVKFTGRQMIGNEGSEIYLPFDDFCLNTELITLGMQWRWVGQWEQR